MKVVAHEGNIYVLSFARGEELMDVLLQWCNEEGMASATFAGLGAADRLMLAYYNVESKEYEKHSIEEEVEILSLTGNLGELNGKKTLHVHGVFGRKNLAAFGGHLLQLHVSGACEIHIYTLSTPFVRTFDAETGLNLL